MLIRNLITIILYIPAFFLAMRYNMHMFQLNGYKNGEHLNRLKGNLKRQWLLVFIFILGCIRLFLTWFILDILIYLTLLLVILVYNAMKKLNTKKKLVYTARVKRMVATVFTVSALIIVPAVIFLDPGRLSGVFAILVGAQLLMDVIANIINHPVEWGVRQYYINDAKRMLRESPNLKIIGVTGSYGKTSVKFYLQTLLKDSFNVLVTPESYNTPMGVVRTIRESLKSTHEIFVCEMGARHVGDIKELCDIVHPHHGLITSIGPQHLETFFNMDNIKNTKFELADALPDNGMLFLNGDNEYIREKAADYKNVVFYRTKFPEAEIPGNALSDPMKTSGDDRVGNTVIENNGYVAGNIRVSQMGTDFTVTAPDGSSESYQMRLIGAHNVINVVGAIAVANRLGIPLSGLKIPVRRLQSVEHRMQLREHGLVTIIDDAYNSNPVGSKAAVETLKLFDGIRILVTPGMVELGDKEEEYNYKFGIYAAKCCDYILLIGKNRTKPIYDGVLSEGFPEDKLKVFDKLEEALACAYEIKGQGHKYILLENDLPDNYR
ncbi:MAG: UDP-N-acetylmuramoyl-tripeptide--D-alanyl-D-alanine ligase [Lachnospiraceae bacterium]|nr:UDP-N-acetylmuramoyl-tripeptide--D-alanyl-D-alanine ligase [Lachnospiraceae bacterium]